MDQDEEFEPHLGRIRARGSSRGRKYLHRVLAAATLARGGKGGIPAKRFDGSRIGRGAGVGRVLASRDRFAAFRARRVIVKSRIVRLAGKGFAAAQAHLRYVERDGTTREGGRGQLYGASEDAADGKAFLERGRGDRHQFRFIVSPEDGVEYDDLKSLTRRLMARMEEDLGTKLDWVAVDHFNTGHPHTHILLRGRDDRDRDLIIAREYVTQGMRERASELVDLDLGPRTADAIRERLSAEIEQQRLTRIDRMLLQEMDAARLVNATGRDAFDQSLRAGRLTMLERMGLASRMGAATWRLDPELADTLKRLGERGDIIRTMQRAFTSRGHAPALVDQVIYDPSRAGARPLVGRQLERGLSNELEDRHYLLVEATDGRTYYVEIGRGENVDAHTNGAILRIEPVAHGVREVDRTIVAVAAENGGNYDIESHLRHVPSASQAFAATHVRRLEAIRRRTQGVDRDGEGRWRITPDHFDRVTAYEASLARDRPVRVTTLSTRPLEALIEVDAASWIDQELVAQTPEPLREAGFGQAVRDAQDRRRQWLIAQCFAEQVEGQTRYRPDLIEALRRRELLRVAGQMSREFGLDFAEAMPGMRVEGMYRRPVDLLGGRYALIERSRDFTLVPWRPVLERHAGKHVSGMLRTEGINWSIGRGRSGPSIS